MLLLLAFAPVLVGGGGGEQALRDAECSDKVIITYIEKGKKAATQQAQKDFVMVDQKCLSAAMNLPNDHRASSPRIEEDHNDASRSNDRLSTLSTEVGDAEQKWRDRLAQVHCRTIVKPAARSEADLDLLEDRALEHNNPDCAIFVAEAYRKRGDSKKGDDLAKKVLINYADRGAPTYPLILYYKIAYLGGGDSDLTNLKGAQGDMGLADRAVEIALAEKRAGFAKVFADKRTELENYIKNPGAEVCPDIDVLNDASALQWMQDLAVNTKALCTRITEWERLEKRRSNSPKTHLAPNVTGKALSEALNEVAVLYPFPFGKKKIPEPRWITTSRIDVNCVVSFEQHVNTFLSMRKFDRISQAGADALERALAALNAGCNPAVSNFRIPKEQVKKRLAGIRDAIRRKPPSAIAASSAQATIVSSATTINGLLDEIDAKVADDPLALGDLPDQWWEKAVPYIRVGNFPKAYEKLLGLLKHHNMCKENHFRVYSENEISSNCQKYNPKALLNTGNQDGQFLVNWDPVVFHDLVRDAHAEAKKSPRPQNRQLAQPHRTWSSLFSVVNKMSKQGWINNANRHGIQAFEDKVVEQLASVGYDYSTYVSEDTRRAVAPDPAWIWVAFADCRIFEKRWKDAIENLVIAATKATEENQSTRKLIVLRLQKASEEAKAKSVPEYGPENLEAMVKKLTRVKPPEWLLTALRESVPSYAEDTNRKITQQQRQTVDANGNEYMCSVLAERGTATEKCTWFKKYWEELKELPYYSAIISALDYQEQQGLESLFSDATTTKPDLFRIISAWDAAELGLTDPKGVQKEDPWLLDSIRSENAQQLWNLSNKITGNDRFTKWIEGAKNEHRRFILRHAVIRRAIELDCKQIATKEAKQIIDSKYINAFDESAEKIGKLHKAVEKAIQAMPEDNPNCGTEP